METERMRWVVLIVWSVFMLLSVNAFFYTLFSSGMPADESFAAILVLATIALFGGYGSAMGFRAARLTRELRDIKTAPDTFS
jgi:hypothetical protein